MTHEHFPGCTRDPDHDGPCNPPIPSPKQLVHKHPLFRVVRVVVKDIDTNPRIQNRIHTFGFWYWTANFPLITYLFFFQQKLWFQYGLFITLIYSIYANWTSDYTGMSASQGLGPGTETEIEVKEQTS